MLLLMILNIHLQDMGMDMGMDTAHQDMVIMRKNKTSMNH
jgi:hypothetical protein